MHKLFRVNLANQDERNAWYLILEIFWASMLASAAVFNAAFAVRLGASNAQVGLLSSLPALFAVLVSIPAGRFLQSRARPKAWILWALGMHRSGFLLVALLPWIKWFDIPTGTLVIGLLVVNTIPAHFFNIGFVPMLADVIPAERRAAVFSMRNMVYNAANMLFVFLFGQWLNRVAFPLNYQTMYIFGWVTSLISVYYLIKIQVLDAQPAAAQPGEGRRSLAGRWRDFRQVFSDHPGFTHISINTFLHGLGLWLAAPLYVLYFVRQLNASDAWLGLNGTIASGATIAGYALWRWGMARWGEAKTLRRTIPLIGVYPLLVGLSHSLVLPLFAVGFNSVMAAGVNLSHFNILLKTMPPARRAEFTALYTALMNIGAFVSPLVGVALAERFGLSTMLIIFGLLSSLGSLSFWLWPVKEQGVQSE